MQQEFAIEESRGNQLRGERFCPMEDELLLFYLKPLLSGQKVPGRNKVVFDCDLYGHQEPWEIWEDFKSKRPDDLRLHKDLYVFTQLKKISSTDKRIRRTVGSGNWHGNVSAKPVECFETGRVVGSKKIFRYQNKASVHHGCWILYEFDLDRSLRDKKEKVKDYVLCLLRKNGEPESKIEKNQSKIQKKRKQREEEEVPESNDVSNDEEQSSTEQEQLLEPQAKRQETLLPSIDNPILVSLPTPSEDDAYVALLEDSLECFQDDHSPSSEADTVGFQSGENMGLQQLASEVQSGPSYGGDHLEIYPLPDEDFLMEELLEGCPNIEREEQNLDVINNPICHQPPTSMPLTCRPGIVGGPGFHQDEILVQQMGDEAFGEVDLHGGNCTDDSMVGDAWLKSLDELLNDGESIAMDFAY